jgi:hypothetical protein
MGRAPRRRAEQRASVTGKVFPPQHPPRPAPVRVVPWAARAGLVRLGELRAQQLELERHVDEQVRELVVAGASWADLGRALGISRGPKPPAARLAAVAWACCPICRRTGHGSLRNPGSCPQRRHHRARRPRRRRGHRPLRTFHGPRQTNGFPHGQERGSPASRRASTLEVAQGESRHDARTPARAVRGCSGPDLRKRTAGRRPTRTPPSQWTPAHERCALDVAGAEAATAIAEAAARRTTLDGRRTSRWCALAAASLHDLRLDTRFRNREETPAVTLGGRPAVTRPVAAKSTADRSESFIS